MLVSMSAGLFATLIAMIVMIPDDQVLRYPWLRAIVAMVFIAAVVLTAFAFQGYEINWGWVR